MKQCSWRYPNIVDEILNGLVVILLQLVVIGVRSDFVLESLVIDSEGLRKLQN